MPRRRFPKAPSQRGSRPDLQKQCGRSPPSKAFELAPSYQTPVTRAIWQMAASERARGQSDQLLLPNYGLVSCLDVGRETILAAPVRILGHLHFLLDVIERLARL